MLYMYSSETPVFLQKLQLLPHFNTLLNIYADTCTQDAKGLKLIS